MRSNARTVQAYLDALPDDRRRAIKTVRALIRKHLPRGYEEAMNWGMIAYQVPLKTYSDTYNGQPLMYAALASQKNHMAVYLTGIYASAPARTAFETAYRATGKRFDVGKSCVRFRHLEDLPLPLIGQAIGSMSVANLVGLVSDGTSVRKARASTATGSPAEKPPRRGAKKR